MRGNCENVSVSQSEGKEQKKEGLLQSAQEDVEGEKVKRLMSLLGQSVIENKENRTLHLQDGCLDVFGHIKLTATVTQHAGVYLLCSG